MRIPALAKVLKVKDAEGHEHADDGKFTSGSGGAGKGNVSTDHHQPEIKDLASAKSWAMSNLIEDQNWDAPDGMSPEKEQELREEFDPVKLDGIPAPVASTFLTTFGQVMQKHGLPKLEKITNKTSREHPHAVAAFSTDTGGQGPQLNINKTFIDGLTAKGTDLATWAKAQQDDGFLAGGTVEDLAYHEAMHYYAHNQKSGKWLETLRECYKTAIEDGSIKRISRYAEENENEFYAEAMVKAKNSDLRSFATKHTIKLFKELMPQ